MDLKGLGGGGTWKGFSDNDLQTLKVKPAPPQVQVPPVKSSPDLPPSSPTLNASTSPSVQSHPTQPIPKVLEKELRTPSAEQTGSRLSVNGTITDTDNDQTGRAQPNLEELQRQQNQMEEDNKRKKTVLEQTLIQRYKQSKQESSKLEKVRFELNRLDQLVTRDVAILRGSIESASREYTQARSRFDHAERAYVSAKMALHSCSERKQLLSEHLCTIIQENESRKAHKLSQLMTELNVSEDSVVPSEETSQENNHVCTQ